MRILNWKAVFINLMFVRTCIITTRTKTTNKLQQIPFINLFKSALSVSRDKLAHPQKHFLTVYTAFGTMHRYRCTVPKAVHTVKKCSWGWASLSPETCRAYLKRSINGICCILLVAYIVERASNLFRFKFQCGHNFHLLHINNCPTKCDTKRSIYYSASSLYMFRVSTKLAWPRWREVAAQKKYDQYRRL